TSFTEGRVAYIPAREGKLIVIGDLHGDEHVLKKILEEIHYDPRANAFSEAPLYLGFLGDYGDVGHRGLDVLFKVLELMQLDPAHVVLLPGNHDVDTPTPESHNVRATSHPWLFQQMEQAFGAKEGAELFKEWTELCQRLPVILTFPNGVELLHATTPSLL